MTERAVKQGILIERAIGGRPFLWNGTTLHVYDVEPEQQLSIIRELRRHGITSSATIQHTTQETKRLYRVIVEAPKCDDCGARVTGWIGSLADVRCWKCGPAKPIRTGETGETMMKAFHALTDADLDALYPGAPPDPVLIAAYRALREHHVTETTALTKRDRSSIMRMAGNIAGGLFADPEFEADSAKEVAEKAVSIARAIVAAVDAEEPAP